MNNLTIPKYISSFDLEQARLGQALQSSILELKSQKENNAFIKILENSELLKFALIKIRNESVNAEWALKSIEEQFIESSKFEANIVHEVISNLISVLLKNKN